MMTRVTERFGKKLMVRLAALATVGLGVSGCTYDMGLGYASDGYGSGYYECDPYGGYDSYYDCDNSYGFSNIGYTGGWYNDYWYPGYGFYLFDNGGRRYAMRDNDRRYWGERRHNWYRENRGRGREGGRYQGRNPNYSDNATPSAIGWPETNGGRMLNGDGDQRGRRDGEGRRPRNDQWREGNGYGASAVPFPNPEVAQRSGRGRDLGEGNGRRRDGDGQGRPARRGNEGANAVPVAPQPDQPGARHGSRGDGSRVEGRVYRQPAPQPSSGQADAPVYRPPPQPRREAPRQRVSKGGAEQPD